MRSGYRSWRADDVNESAGVSDNNENWVASCNDDDDYDDDDNDNNNNINNTIYQKPFGTRLFSEIGIFRVFQALRFLIIMIIIIIIIFVVVRYSGCF